MKWMTNPVDGKPSVSLTMMFVSFLVAMVISILQVFKAVDAGGMSLEIFLATSALYFGNKFTARGKTMEVLSEKIQQLDNPEKKQE
jgi:hypothetical protein